MDTSQMLRQSWDRWLSQTGTPAGPAWLQYVWTFLFSCGVAAFFTVFGFVAYGGGDGAWRNWAGWGEWYLNYLIVSLAIGFSIHGLFNLGRRVVGPSRVARLAHWQRGLYFGGIPLAGAAIGMTLGGALLGQPVRTWWAGRDTNAVVGSMLVSLLAWLVITQYFMARQRRIVAERQAAQAQLRLLQAQMEPHFLFNTLANVAGLMDADLPRARAMLESFTDYLRASLGSFRRAEQTLGEELDLVDAYLRIASVRMEDRLRYRIEVDAALRGLRLPTLSIQPLVENAIQHGLEPQIDGGTVTVTATAHAGLLTVTVDDDGRGPGGAPSRAGTGTALANIRERLLQAYGARAGVSLAAAHPRGTRATLTLPMEIERP